jgi:flavodoxin
MKKLLIRCYSKTGNSRFMAEMLAEQLHCEFAHYSDYRVSAVFISDLLSENTYPD